MAINKAAKPIVEPVIDAESATIAEAAKNTELGQAIGSDEAFSAAVQKAEEARQARISELNASIKEHTKAIQEAEEEKARVQAELVKQDADENAVKIMVKNTTKNTIAGIRPDQHGEVTLGFFKSAVGLVEV